MAIKSRMMTGATVQTISMIVLWLVRDGVGLTLSRKRQMQ